MKKTYQVIFLNNFYIDCSNNSNEKFDKNKQYKNNNNCNKFNIKDESSFLKIEDIKHINNNFVINQTDENKINNNENNIKQKLNKNDINNNNNNHIFKNECLNNYYNKFLSSEEKITSYTERLKNCKLKDENKNEISPIKNKIEFKSKYLNQIMNCKENNKEIKQKNNEEFKVLNTNSDIKLNSNNNNNKNKDKENTNEKQSNFFNINNDSLSRNKKITNKELSNIKLIKKNKSVDNNNNNNKKNIIIINKKNLKLNNSNGKEIKTNQSSKNKIKLKINKTKNDNNKINNNKTQTTTKIIKLNNFNSNKKLNNKNINTNSYLYKAISIQGKINNIKKLDKKLTSHENIFKKNISKNINYDIIADNFPIKTLKNNKSFIEPKKERKSIFEKIENIKYQNIEEYEKSIDNKRFTFKPKNIINNNNENNNFDYKINENINLENINNIDNIKNTNIIKKYNKN